MATATPSLATLQRLVHLCEGRYQELTASGCNEDVAADRVFDALECVLERQEQHCFDKRDSLFENRLRTELKRKVRHEGT